MWPQRGHYIGEGDSANSVLNTEPPSIFALITTSGTLSLPPQHIVTIIMKSIKNIINGILLIATAIMSLTSCGMMTEEEPDCNPYYKVRFRFDRNMLYADAFSTQVGEVDLYVFDTDGKLVWQGHEEGQKLASEDYLMDLPVKPGRYDLIAWCRKRHADAADFRLSGGDSPKTKEDLRMMMERERDGEIAYSETDLHALFHGEKDNVELPDSWGTHMVTMPLTKDTNCIRIMLVHLSGKEIKRDDFDFKITDSSGYLDHDNTMLEDEPVEFRSWSKTEGLASMILPVVPDGNRSASQSLTRASQIHSLTAEMTTSRLQTSHKPILTITRKSDGEKVVEIPIIDYFMMVKGQYHHDMEDDEYLDRQDEYNMTFFMLDDGSWYKAVIDILSWRVVLQGADL